FSLLLLSSPLLLLFILCECSEEKTHAQTPRVHDGSVDVSLRPRRRCAGSWTIRIDDGNSRRGRRHLARRGLDCGQTRAVVLSRLERLDDDRQHEPESRPCRQRDFLRHKARQPSYLPQPSVLLLETEEQNTDAGAAIGNQRIGVWRQWLVWSSILIRSAVRRVR